jgi:exosome complex RNA-binding protein Rrp4
MVDGCTKALSKDQQTDVPSGQNGCIWVDAFRQSIQRHPEGGILCNLHQCIMSVCIAPYNCSITISSRSIGLLFQANTPALCPTLTIHQNEVSENALVSEMQCDGWHCENLSLQSSYQCTECNSPFTKHTQHSKSLDLCGFWQSFARCFRLLCYE